MRGWAWFVLARQGRRGPVRQGAGGMAWPGEVWQVRWGPARSGWYRTGKAKFIIMTRKEKSSWQQQNRKNP